MSFRDPLQYGGWKAEDHAKLTRSQVSIEVMRCLNMLWVDGKSWAFDLN